MPPSGTLTAVFTKDISVDLVSLPVVATRQSAAVVRRGRACWDLSGEAVRTSEINPQGLPKT